MLSETSDPFLFRLAVFALAVVAGLMFGAGTRRGFRRTLILAAGLLAAALAAASIYATGRLPSGTGRTIAFIALALSAVGLSSGLVLAWRTGPGSSREGNG
ncbi:hypothetical protein J5N58_05090 [Rhizobium cremeum]|uniref:hypothetical protein n=1 Tax=Rhizobium cremeum TaxID=2813827 RepID=UPI0013AF45AF|nr:hypothetical protein [Rhizobium cremeum]MCJ7993991.1 hypothetical protein [Rhizobium cremeum]MCJ7999048.1 hypothetical protein [Rhizobium cremeum]